MSQTDAAANPASPIERVTHDQLLSRKEAARYLTGMGLVTAPQTLARKFVEGTGPLCTHVGDRAMYWRADLNAYFSALVSQPRRSSSEPRRSLREGGQL
jgi:hypothetical protein